MICLKHRMGWMENGMELRKGKVFKGIGEDPKLCLSTHSPSEKKNLGQLGFKRNNSTLQVTAQQLSSNLRRLKWPADFGKRFVSVSSPAKNPMGFHRNKHDITIIIITYTFFPWATSDQNPIEHLPNILPSLKRKPWKSLVGSRSFPFGCNPTDLSE